MVAAAKAALEHCGHRPMVGRVHVAAAAGGVAADPAAAAVVGVREAAAAADAAVAPASAVQAGAATGSVGAAEHLRDCHSTAVRRQGALGSQTVLDLVRAPPDSTWQEQCCPSALVLPASWHGIGIESDDAISVSTVHVVRH